MTVELYEEDGPFEIMEKIAKLSMQGKSEFAIARQIKIPTVEVKNYLDMWRDRLVHDKLAQDKARDQLFQMVEHYNVLIEKSYTLLDELEGMETTHQVAAQRIGAMKTIGEFDSKRVDLLQKAGMLEGAEIGAEIAEMERKQEILINILRESLCDICQPVVRRRLSEVTGKVESIREEADDA